MRDIKVAKEALAKLREKLDEHQAQGHLEYEKVKMEFVNKDISLKVVLKSGKVKIASEFQGFPVIVERLS